MEHFEQSGHIVMLGIKKNICFPPFALLRLGFTVFLTSSLAPGKPPVLLRSRPKWPFLDNKAEAETALKSLHRVLKKVCWFL